MYPVSLKGIVASSVYNVRTVYIRLTVFTAASILCLITTDNITADTFLPIIKKVCLNEYLLQLYYNKILHLTFADTNLCFDDLPLLSFATVK
jgi:hypothetical protein